MELDEPVRLLQEFDAEIHNDDGDQNTPNEGDEFLEYMFAEQCHSRYVRD